MSDIDVFETVYPGDFEDVDISKSDQDEENDLFDEEPEKVKPKEKNPVDPKTRRARRIRIALIAAAVLIVIAFFGMRITTVTVEANEHVSQETVEQEVFGDSWWLRNPFVFFVHEKIASHGEIPFVDRYTVTLSGLNAAHIIVYEKDIIGYIEVLDCCMYFDKDGYIVESSMSSRSDVPRIEGMDVDTMVLGEQILTDNTDLFQVILNTSLYLQENTITWGSENQLLVELLDHIEVNEQNHVTCVFGEIRVYLGNHSDMEEKLLEMSSILPELKGRKGTLYLNTYSSANPNPTYVFKDDAEEENEEEGYSADENTGEDSQDESDDDYED